MSDTYPTGSLWGTGSHDCECKQDTHDPRLIVLTGGPSAGKTAVLEMVIKTFCPHVTVVPEAASIIFKGGFFRRETVPAKKGAQRTIFKVQRELERIIHEEKTAAVAVCDRGTVDGQVYWPGPEDEFWRETESSKEAELYRYKAVVHLRTPEPGEGYNLDNPVRVESAEQAREVDEKLLEVWADHDSRHVIESRDDFLEKAREALETIQGYLPPCCQKTEIDSVKNVGKTS